MKLQERSFVSSASYRPRPTIHYNEDLGLVFIATNWGKDFDKQELIQRIESYFISTQSDEELTSPYQPISSYSKMQNYLRIATLMINDFLYKEKNASEYLCGLEIFLGLKKDNQFYYVTYGHPHLLLSRKDKNILPLKLDLDHALDMSKAELPPALPSQLLGVNALIQPEVQTLSVFETDQLLLLSKSWIPEKLLSLKASKRNYEEYQKVISENDNQPAWLGLITF